jgi:hypothetical protein
VLVAALAGIAAVGVVALLPTRLLLALLLVAVPSAPTGVELAGRTFGEPRTGGMIALLGGICLLRRRELSRWLDGRVLMVCLALIGLVPLGILAAADTAQGGSDFLKAASQSAGQPFSYAALLGLFTLVLRTDWESERVLFAAWGIALGVQAAVCLGQFISGSAFIARLGYSRANGTMGSDFLGAFAMLSVFAALHVRTTAGNS